MSDIDKVTKHFVAHRREALEEVLQADVIAYYGPISRGLIKPYTETLEGISAEGKNRRSKLAICLHTGGGEVEAVERMVEITRRWYAEVIFVVPEMAMSAGTIFCMSGDRILMDYTSALGPIDPQVQNKDGQLVPALGYLDKYNEIVEKAKNQDLSSVEFAIAQNQDLATLRRYEQARDLSVDLLKKWLVEYKFKDWTTHRSPGPKQNKPVTQEEKEERAQEIAAMLGDNHRWHSHGRMIGIGTLQSKLRLEIDDYTDKEKRKVIRDFHEIIMDYMERYGLYFFSHGDNSYEELRYVNR